MGTATIPGDLEQYRPWIQDVLLQGENTSLWIRNNLPGPSGRVETKLRLKKKIIKHPAEIIVHAYAFMSHWAGLFSADFVGGITDGVKVMLALAHKILAHQRRGPVVKLLLAPREDQKDDEEP
jgi:hypothetical protein